MAAMNESEELLRFRKVEMLGSKTAVCAYLSRDGMQGGTARVRWETANVTYGQFYLYGKIQKSNFVCVRENNIKIDPL